jgi:hypothetical protein
MGFIKTVVEEKVVEEIEKVVEKAKEVEEVKDSIQDILKNDSKLARICQSNHFMMRQHSDIMDSGQFDHVTFVDKEPIKNILENAFQLVHIKNDVMIDDYVQLFITEEIFEDNKKVFNNERNGINYSIVDSYDQVFAGFIRTENYFILINSENFEQKYGVYVLIDGSTGDKFICNDSDKKIEFYGFVNIGYLVDPLGYEESTMKHFEEENNFKIPPQIRSYLSNSSIIQHSKKLFHIDIINYNESVKNIFEIPSKNITNSQYIREIVNNKCQESIEENKKFITALTNGFLYIGLLNKVVVPMENEDNIIKRQDSLYILMNFIEHRGIDFSSTLWQYTVMNNNAEKILSNYNDKNANKSLEQFDEMEKKIDIHDPGQIIHSMKYLINIYN